VTRDLPGTSGSGAVIYPPPPISTPLSSNGGGRGQHRHGTDGPMYLQTSPAGDVDNGAGEAGDVFSHTTPDPTPYIVYKKYDKYWLENSSLKEVRSSQLRDLLTYLLNIHFPEVHCIYKHAIMKK